MPAFVFSRSMRLGCFLYLCLLCSFLLGRCFLSFFLLSSGLLYLFRGLLCFLYGLFGFVVLSFSSFNSLLCGLFSLGHLLLYRVGSLLLYLFLGFLGSGLLGRNLLC